MIRECRRFVTFTSFGQNLKAHQLQQFYWKDKSCVRGFATLKDSSKQRKVFDDEVKRMHFEHFCDFSKKFKGEYDYLRDEIAGQLVDRLKDIKRDFPLALDLGCRNGNIGKRLVCEFNETKILSGGVEKLMMIDNSETIIKSASDTVKEEYLRSSIEDYPLTFEQHVANYDELNGVIEENSVDVVLSGLSLHWTNDLAESFKSVKKILKPDGVLLAAMFGNDTLFEMRTALAVAEQEREGGLSPHISPMIRSADTCGLLSDAGFTLTTVDTLNIEVEFVNAFKCMEHLSRMGESNGVINRRYNMRKETFIAAAAAYQSLFQNDDGYIPATFQIVFMIGWKPHESQPKPKEIGSAEHKLGLLGKNYDFTRNRGS